LSATAADVRTRSGLFDTCLCLLLRERMHDACAQASNNF